MDLDRRSALKAFGALAASANISLQAVPTHDAEGITLVIFSCDQRLTNEQRAYIRAAWTQVIEGTSLASVKALVLDGGLSIDFVRVVRP